jgi:DNA-binding MarR family transcriptional regulator
MTPSVERIARTDAGLASVLRVSIARLGRRLRTEQDPAVDLSPSSFAVLGALARLGEQTVGQLATLERVQPPSMTRTVGCLVEGGYVARRPHETDRRQVLVALTPAGEDAVLRERRRRDAWLVQRLREMTPDEREVLRAAAPLLERLASA